MTGQSASLGNPRLFFLDHYYSVNNNFRKEAKVYRPVTGAVRF